MVIFRGDFTKKNGDVGDAAMKNGLTVSENTVIFHGIFYHGISPIKFRCALLFYGNFTNRSGDLIECHGNIMGKMMRYTTKYMGCV